LAIIQLVLLPDDQEHAVPLKDLKKNYQISEVILNQQKNNVDLLDEIVHVLKWIPGFITLALFERVIQKPFSVFRANNTCECIENTAPHCNKNRQLTAPYDQNADDAIRFSVGKHELRRSDNFLDVLLTLK